MILYISVMLGVTSFHYWFYWFRPSYFVSCYDWLKVYQFCLSFQKTIFSFTKKNFFSLYLIFPTLIFMTSFLLLTLGFVFSSFTSIRLGCLFKIFLVSWSRLILLYTSLLPLLFLYPIDFRLLCTHLICLRVFFFYFLFEFYMIHLFSSILFRLPVFVYFLQFYFVVDF